MRLPWRHIREAEQSAEQAEQRLEAVKAETPKIRALAQSLVQIQRTNHLGANAARILRGD